MAMLIFIKYLQDAVVAIMMVVAKYADDDVSGDHDEDNAGHVNCKYVNGNVGNDNHNGD